MDVFGHAGPTPPDGTGTATGADGKGFDSSAAHLSGLFDEVQVVETEDEARRVLAILMDDKLGADRPVYHAIDTEVSHIDVAEQTPVGHGNVICFSVYCGEVREEEKKKKKYENEVAKRYKKQRVIIHSWRKTLSSPALTPLHPAIHDISESRKRTRNKNSVCCAEKSSYDTAPT